MGYRSMLRSLYASARASEREARRQQRELERQARELARQDELEQAKYEVAVYNNLIARMTTLHKDCGDVYEWSKIETARPPSKPRVVHKHERQAVTALENYKPNVFARIFGIAKSKKRKLLASIEEAKQEDGAEYARLLHEHDEDMAEYYNLVEIAKHLNNNELEYFTKTVNDFNPFSEIAELGSGVKFDFYPGRPPKARIIINAHEETVIPKASKTLLKSGKVSVKDLPAGKYNEIYQDYVCSAAIRVARDAFALLPVNEIIVTAKGNCLNSTTGWQEEQPLLSALFVRETLERLNFETIDPSDSMKNFKHNMSFKKTSGMSPTTELVFD